MNAAAEQPTCACGLAMHPVEAGSEFYACYNCDSIQPTEYTGTDDGRSFRTPTVQDRRFNLTWAQRIRGYYPKAA